MVWLFFLILVILFLTPLFIPFILRIHLTTGSRMVWSLHYGFILIAPDGLLKLKYAFIKWSEKIKHILLPLKRYKPLKRHKPYLKDLDYEAGTSDSTIKPREDRTKAPEASEPGSPPQEEFPSPNESESLSPREPSEPFPDNNQWEGGKESDDSTDRGFHWISWVWKKIGQAVKLYRLFLSYRERYGSLVRKTVRLLFQFLRMNLRSFSVPRMRATFAAGGDPAMLGQVMGWYHALGGVIHRDFKQVIQINPDFQNHDFSLTVDAALEIRFYMYKFVLAILVLLFRFPYYGWWKVYRTRRKETTP